MHNWFPHLLNERFRQTSPAASRASAFKKLNFVTKLNLSNFTYQTFQTFQTVLFQNVLAQPCKPRHRPPASQLNCQPKLRCFTRAFFKFHETRVLMASYTHRHLRLPSQSFTLLSFSISNIANFLAELFLKLVF